MDHVIRTMSPESHPITIQCRAAERAAREGNFEKAAAIQRWIAADREGQFFADSVAQYIDRAREQQEKSA